MITLSKPKRLNGNMIKTMLKPFFKRFFGLFISMVFVSMLAVSLLCCFGSCIVNVRNEYEKFVQNNEDVDELVSTEFTTREKLLSVIEGVNEVEDADARLVVDCYLRKKQKDDTIQEDRTIVTRVFSYNDNNTLFHPYPISKPVAVNEQLVNISVAEKFARNNNFKAGDTIELGFLDMWKEFYIKDIVDTPEGIYPRANNYIWSDNSDFGYIYAEEKELDKGLKQIAQAIIDRIGVDSEYKQYYEEAIKQMGITIPSVEEITSNVNFVELFANQILVKNVKGANTDDVVNKINAYFKETGTSHEVKITNTVIKDYLPHIAYMNHALEQVQIASIFLPVFFYTITMIVVGLFINQIIKTMTPQIGVFMSIGISNNSIVGLFLMFSTIMGLTAGLVGAPVGYALSILMAAMMKRTYSIPTIAPGLNVIVTISAIIGLLIFVVITTLIATRAIFRITPKDATISNEAKRKRLPKVIEKFIDKAPMNIKLGTNAIVQNPRRFFVSSFSIFASLVLILLSTFFYVSKEEMIDQSVERRLNYDCQIYMTQKENDQDFITGLRNLSKGEADNKQFEECYYTYLKVDDAESIYLECLAVDPGYNPLINIPTAKGYDRNNYLSVPEMGVILPSSSANTLHKKKGDYISINGHNVQIEAISYQYFHPITYLSKGQMDALELGEGGYVSSYILNVDKTSTSNLLKYLTKNRAQSLTVFTSSLSKDLHNIFDATNSMIFIMVGFSIAMAFIILCIMSQNALMEQQRQLTIFRAIGFTILDISNVWTLQSVGQLLISSLFGVPAGALSIYILLKLCSSSSQAYPFIFSWLVVLMAIGFVLLVIIACHLLAMRSIKKWNIADNTRSRE